MAKKAEAVSHPRARALERYGIALSDADLRAIEARLAAGEGMTLRRNKDGTEVRVIRVMGRLIPVVWGAGKIHTFLPPEAAYRRRRWSDP